MASNLGAFGGFELNSIIRGAQLTIVGAHRALQNPGIFTSDHYRQAALAVAAGIAIRLFVAIPVRPTSNPRQDLYVAQARLTLQDHWNSCPDSFRRPVCRPPSVGLG